MEDLELNITGKDFFKIVAGENLHGLKFLKRVDLEQPEGNLAFFHRSYYFDWNGKKIFSVISSVYWGDDHGFNTSFVHSCGEPSEIGPRFALAAEE